MTKAETEALLRRMEDLARRSEKTAAVTHSGFLTPAEGHSVEQWALRGTDCTVLLHGGGPDCERRAAFFLPGWMEPEGFDPGESLCALELTARFGSPGHRDYLGAILGLGVGREWIGDILVEGERAWVYCLPSVKSHLLLSLDKVGRWGVRTREVPLDQVPGRKREQREETFSVRSLRLDAVCAGMFRLSRTAAAEAIGQGLVQLNYEETTKPDAPVRAGDVLSLRGKGKGEVLEAGEKESRKGRLFVRTGVYIT